MRPMLNILIPTLNVFFILYRKETTTPSRLWYHHHISSSITKLITLVYAVYSESKAAIE